MVDSILRILVEGMSPSDIRVIFISIILIPLIVYLLSVVVGICLRISASRNNGRLIRFMEHYGRFVEDYNKLISEHKGSIRLSEQLSQKLEQFAVTVGRCGRFLTEMASSEYCRGYICIPEDSVTPLELQDLVNDFRDDLKSTAGEVFRCAIWIPAEDKHVRMVAATGFSREKFTGCRRAVDDSVVGSVFRTGRFRNIPDITKEPDFVQFEDHSENYRSLLCIPVKGSDKEVVAVLSADAQDENHFDVMHLAIADLYAGIIASHLEYSKMRGGVLGTSDQTEGA